MNSFLQKCFVVLVVISLSLSQSMPVLANSFEDQAKDSSPNIGISVDGLQNGLLANFPIVKLTNGATFFDTSKQEVNDDKTPIEIKLQATPETLETAGEIVIEWVISGISEKEINGFTLEIILPDGFEFMADR